MEIQRQKQIELKNLMELQTRSDTHDDLLEQQSKSDNLTKNQNQDSQVEISSGDMLTQDFDTQIFSEIFSKLRQAQNSPNKYLLEEFKLNFADKVPYQRNDFSDVVIIDSNQITQLIYAMIQYATSQIFFIRPQKRDSTTIQIRCRNKTPGKKVALKPQQSSNNKIKTEKNYIQFKVKLFIEYFPSYAKRIYPMNDPRIEIMESLLKQFQHQNFSKNHLIKLFEKFKDEFPQINFINRRIMHKILSEKAVHKIQSSSHMKKKQNYLIACKMDLIRMRCGGLSIRSQIPS